MLRVAVIGAGRIGLVHARSVAVHPDAQLVSVCDPVGNAAEELAAQFNARHTKDPQEVFADPDIDAVVIGSPTPFHYEQVLGAARAGKAVLVEKPVASNVEEARRLASELESFDHPPVMVGFNRRFDPSMRRARELAHDGSIGPVSQVTIISRDPAPPTVEYLANSGGIFKDMTIHDFDMARYFLGEITEVTAVGQAMDPAVAEIGDFDAAIIILKAASGATASITNNRSNATGYDQRIEVQGTEGSLSVSNQRGSSLLISTRDYTDAADPYLDFFLTRYAEAYTAELTVFIDAINNGTEVSPTVQDGVEALVLAQAATDSAQTGHTVRLDSAQ